MCFGSGTNTTTTTSGLTPTAQANYDYITGRAKGVADIPYQYYPGNLVAGTSGQTQSGYDIINQSQGVAAPYIAQAAQYAQQGAAPISASQIQGYSNPFQQQVIDATMANVNEVNSRQQQDVVGNAISKGAWGGDRAGVAQAELARQQGLAAGQTFAGLNAQNYSQALTAAQQDAQRQAQAGYTFGALGQEAQSTALQGANAQIAAGQLQQQQSQNQINADYSQYQQAKQYPFNTTSWLASILGGTNTGGTSSTTSPAPGIAQQAVGAGAGIAGILGATGAFGSSGWLWSDERLKENIQAIGRAFDGQMIYRYNFKGDPKTQIGFIAQEVERHMPGAVHEIDGIKGVDYHDATDEAADRGGFASGGIPAMRSPLIPSIDSYTPEMDSPAMGPLVAGGFDLKSITKPAYEQAQGGFADGGTVPYGGDFMSPYPMLEPVNGLMPSAASMAAPALRSASVAGRGGSGIPAAPGAPANKSDIGGDVIRLAQMLRQSGLGKSARPQQAPEGGYDSVGSLVRGLGLNRGGMARRGLRDGGVYGADDDADYLPPVMLAQVPVELPPPQPVPLPPRPARSVTVPWPAPPAAPSIEPVPLPAPAQADVVPAAAGVVPGSIPSRQGGYGEVAAPTGVVAPAAAPPPSAPAGVAPLEDAPAARPGSFNVGNILAPGRTPGPGAWRTFDTPEAAVAAVRDNLQTYPRAFNGGKPMSILQIAPHWSQGKDTLDAGSQAWARNVAVTAGLDPDKPLDFNDPAVMARLAKGIHVAEFGQGALFPDDVYARGVTGGPAGPGNPGTSVAKAPSGVVPPADDAGDDKPPPKDGGASGDFMNNPWMALAAMGFGMAGSNNPRFLGALGEGGLKGVQFAQEQMKARRELEALKSTQAYRTAQLELSRQQGSRRDRQVDEQLRAHTQIETDRARRADEAERRNQATENDRQRRMDDAERVARDRDALARARIDKPTMTKDTDPYTQEPIWANGHGDLFLKGEDGKLTPYTGIRSGAQYSGYQHDPAKERTVTLSSGDATIPAFDRRDVTLDRDTQKAAIKRADEIRKAGAGAGDVQRQLNELKKAYAGLPTTGAMAPGAWAETWRNVARQANALTDTLGLPPTFDPAKVGSLDEMKKLTIQLAATATKAFNGSRPTNFDFEQMLQGTPGAQLGPEAFNRIVGFMQAQNDRARDLAKYTTEYQRHRRTAFGVDDAFNQQRPDDFYTKQAGIGVAPQRAGQPGAAGAGADPGYKPGQIIPGKDGKSFKFKGGDWRDRSNYELVP